MKRLHEFDYVVVNADAEQAQAVDQLLAIIDAAHCQVKQEPIIL